MDNIRIVGRHIEVTAAIADYVRKRVGVADRYLHNITSMQVILEVQKYRHTVEVVAHTTSRRIIAIKETDKDLYEAIDKMASRFKDALIRHKDRLTVSRKQRIKLTGMEVPEPPDEALERTSVPVARLSLEDALEQFRTSRRIFLPFVDKRTGKICILYDNDGECLAELNLPRD